MRIGIDARFYGTLGKGLGRYTQKLIENLEKLDDTNEYFVFLRKENFEEYRPKNKNFQKVLADCGWYTISEQLNMPKILNKHNLDLVHFPHFNVPLFYKKPFIITIHDLILLHFPTVKSTSLNPLWYKIKYLAYKLIIKNAILKAKNIITVSNFTKNDILRHYNVTENKITVTYEAADINVTQNRLKNDSNILEKYGIIKPYILYVGNAYPHKNLEALVLGFGKVAMSFRASDSESRNLIERNKKIRSFDYVSRRHFAQDDTSLVLVGKEDYFYKRIKGLVIEKNIKNIIFTDFVPDDELDTVYRNSLFYIFPSLYEGFGLPPIEAMARNVPVLSSDIPCLREILGESACYFNASSKENIARAITDFSENKELREKLSQRGNEWVKIYSWEKMARETLTIYKN